MVRDLGVFAPILKALLFPIIFIFFKTLLQGAQTTLYLTLEEDCNFHKDEYYADCNGRRVLSSAATSTTQPNSGKLAKNSSTSSLISELS
jgi:hypothetical protein